MDSKNPTQMNQLSSKSGFFLVLPDIDKLTDEFIIESWATELLAIPDQVSEGSLALDLRNVEILTSSALRAIITLKFNCDVKKIRFILCGAKPFVMKTFLLTRLDKAMVVREEIFEELPAEVMAFSNESLSLEIKP